MNFYEAINRFIARIRESDDRTKNFWVAVFTAVAMVFVVALWLVQIGNSVVAFDVAGEGDDGENSAASSSSWKTFGAGLAEIGGTIGAGLKKLGEGRSVTIENKAPNFAAGNTEETKPVPLR